MNAKILEMISISKSFTGVRALSEVDLSISEGSVHSIMGENGAGKSTLIKVLTGLYKKDAGKIIFNGNEINPRNPLDAQHVGISTIYQELNLIPTLSVAENIFIGREMKRNGRILWDEINRGAEDLLQGLCIDVDVTLPLNRFGAAIQQMVAISRAISIESKLVVMDEPTSSLDDDEVKILFNVIEELKKRNIATIFISHRLSEVFHISDEITILRDGKLVGSYKTDNISQLELVTLMIGRDATNLLKNVKEKRIDYKNTKPFITAENIIRGKKLNGVDFEIRRGEILGFAGLLGSGRTELARILFGADKPESGRILINGERVVFNKPKEAISRNIAFCSENRKSEGIFPFLSVKENLTIASLKRCSRGGVLDKRKLDRLCNEFTEKIRIKTPSPRERIRNLSGGNQQKVILSRWLAVQPELIILDEPTRGIDVGAKAEIEKIIQEMAASGISVVMISSEFEELIRGCDRVIVIREGHITKELFYEEITEKNIMEAITHGS